MCSECRSRVVVDQVGSTHDDTHRTNVENLLSERFESSILMDVEHIFCVVWTGFEGFRFGLICDNLEGT